MSLTKASYSMITGAPANVLDYGAVPDGVTDCTAAFQAAILANTSVYVPEGNYVISQTLKLTRQGSTFIGAGHPAYPYSSSSEFGGTWLIWTGTTGNVIELNSRRRDLPSAVTVLTGAYVANFSIALGAGSSCDNMLWIENGVLHSTVEMLYLQSYYGGLPTNSMICLEDAGINDYPLGVCLRDITVRNSDPASATAIPCGMQIRGCIESVFERIAIYDCDDGFQIGTGTPNQGTIQNCNFTGLIAEIGDRYNCNPAGSGISIYGGSNLNFYGCKFVSAAAAVGAPWNTHASLRLKPNTLDVPTQVNFNGCIFWGFQVADYAIQAAQTDNPQSVIFDNCVFLAFATGIVSTVWPATPELVFNNPDFRRAKFDGYPKESFSAIGYTSGVQSITTKAVLRINASDARLPYKKAFNLCSFSHNGGEPLLISAAQQTYSFYGTEFAVYNAGTNTATVTALNVARVRSLTDGEIITQSSTAYTSGFVGNGNVSNIDIYVAGAAFGDHAFGAYSSDASPTGASFVLNNMQIGAHVIAPNTVRFQFMNKTGGGFSLPSGQILACVGAPKFDIVYTETYDAPSIANTAELLRDVTVTGVLAGDYVSVAPSQSIQGLFIKSTVKADNTVTLYFYNETGGAVDLPSMNYYIGVVKQPITA